MRYARYRVSTAHIAEKMFRLSSDDEEENDEVYDVKKAHERLLTLSESDDSSVQSI